MKFNLIQFDGHDGHRRTIVYGEKNDTVQHNGEHPV